MLISGYDCETWSSNQISLGLEHYFDDPDFEIICAGFAPEGKPASVAVSALMQPTDGAKYVYAAHNAHFDRSAVRTMYPDQRDEILWFDTMIGVRALLGASAGQNSYVSLDKSAKLFLPEEFHKDQAGASLMSYFSFPSTLNNFGAKSWRQMRDRYPSEWDRYVDYCMQDAVVARELAMLTREAMGEAAFERLVYEAEITYRMNQVGWPVDQKLLQAMSEQAQWNTEQSLDTLINDFNPGWYTIKKNGDENFKPLNLNSGVQLKKWLGERGVTIENTQADTILETIEYVEDNIDTLQDWEEILSVLQTKVDLGGATLKKLAPIAKNMSGDGRLRQMYNHIAASSTHRTTGSGVQMQNLKRLPDDVEDLTEAGIKKMNNGELAKNIRQLFLAQETGGQIVVADLKSIEGLLVGWVFGVDWMVEAVREGKDMYKMSASERFNVDYDSVLPEQRRQAKTGVLAGNYGGGMNAYIKASHGSLTEEAAKADVKAYRETVPTLVQSWWDLNDMLVEAVEEGSSSLRLFNGFLVIAEMIDSVPGLDTLRISLLQNQDIVLERLWHGVRLEENENGRKEITYAVLDERKTAVDSWKRLNSEGQPFRLYGGKLTGTLIQSLARELYFYQLQILSTHKFVRLIGQLHDEIVAEWWPSDTQALHTIEATIEMAFTEVPWYLKGCPVRVKVSHAPRYIK